MAYYAIEPWGEAQSEYRAGLISSTIANTARDPKKRPSEFKAEEFMRRSYLMEQREETDGNGLWMKAKMIFGRFKTTPPRPSPFSTKMERGEEGIHQAANLERGEEATKVATTSAQSGKAVKQ